MKQTGEVKAFWPIEIGRQEHAPPIFSLVRIPISGEATGGAYFPHLEMEQGQQLM